MMPFSKNLRDLRYRIFYGLLLRRGYELKTLGDPRGICQWTICPWRLGRTSVVYSGGLGSDITFEHDLVREFGCHVMLYDPSPTGQKTMSLPENKIPQFHFSSTALAGCAGKLMLASPRPGGDSWFSKTDGSGDLEVVCSDLSSQMRANGHEHIDLLKLDIEGSEYEVIDDILRRRIPVHQICVEYHHGLLPGIQLRQTVRSMLKLVARGYRLLDQTGYNHTWILAHSVKVRG